jgi:hypothetical protein
VPGTNQAQLFMPLKWRAQKLHKNAQREHSLIDIYIYWWLKRAWHRNGTTTGFLIWTKNQHRIGTKEHKPFTLFPLKNVCAFFVESLYL